MTPLLTDFYCVACHRALCTSCAGGGARNTCFLIHCKGCRLAAGVAEQLDSSDVDLQHQRALFHAAALQGVIHVEQSLFSLRTYKRHTYNLHVWESYAAVAGVRPYPVSQVQLDNFTLYGLTMREPPLDPSSLELVVGAISGWHIQCEDALRRIYGVQQALYTAGGGR